MRIYIALILFTLIVGCKKKTGDIDLPKTNLEIIIAEKWNVDSTSCILNLHNVIQSIAIEQFGAIANDDKDDSEAFQKAIDKGYDIILKGGTYNIMNEIKIFDKKNLRIDGSSKAKLISTNKDSTAVFKLKNCRGVIISNITFIGGAKSPDTYNKAINLKEGNSYIAVFNCVFDGTNSEGFNFGFDAHVGGEYLYISNCSFRNLMGNTSGNGYGIHLKFVKNAKVCSNNFQGRPGRSRHAVYVSAGTQMCEVSNNIIKDFDWEGITLNCFSYQEPNQYNIIKNNIIIRGCVANFEGIGQISIYGKCWNNLIINNTLIDSKKIGIYLSGSSGDNFLEENISKNNRIINNTISNTGSYGVFFSGIKNNEFDHNEINQAGLNNTDGFGYPAIYIGPNVFNSNLPATDGLIISNNIVTGSKITRSCLYIDNDYKKPQNISLCNNTFPKLRISTIELNGTSVLNNCN